MHKDNWQAVRTYVDHIGQRVVLEQFISPNDPDEPEYSPEPDHLVPIQVYSLVPLDDDHEKLRDYLLQSFWDDEVKPLFEIYSYCPPDAFACIEHNRLEIAHRKQQHRSGVKNPPPLIPQFKHRDRSSLNVGLCVLLRSHSYRLGHCYDREESDKVGEGPDLVYFTRSFSSTRSDVDEAQCSSESGIISSRAFELSIDRLTDQSDIGQIIILDIFNQVDRAGLREAMEIEEGEPPNSNPPSEEQIRDQLGLETSIGGFSLRQSFRVSQDADIVTVTNAPEGSVPDIQYVVHALFLSSIRDTAESLLESTACLFTASIASHLPANNTIVLRFFIPKSSSWSAIRPAQTEVLEALQAQSNQAKEQNRDVPFPTGALQTLPAGEDQLPSAHRTNPQGSEGCFVAAPGPSRPKFRLFTVVLDRARFVSEAGVYFYMADWDSSGDPDPCAEDGPDDTRVFRGMDMNTVAQYLEMVDLDD